MATVAKVGEPVPPTCPFEAVSVASVVSTIWRRQLANLDPRQILASVHLPEIAVVVPDVSMQLRDLSIC